MSAVPPSAGTTAPVSSPPLPQAAASVPQAPEALLRLAAGTQIQATVVDASTRGTVTLETALGNLTLKTPLPLPEGSSLTLNMTGIQGETALLRIATLDGKPLAQAMMDFVAQGRLSLSPGKGATVASPLQPFAPGHASSPNHATQAGATPWGTAAASSLSTPFSATVLRSASLMPGSELTVRLTGLATPGNGAAGNPGGGVMGSSQQQAGGSPGQSAGGLGAIGPVGSGSVSGVLSKGPGGIPAGGGAGNPGIGGAGLPASGQSVGQSAGLGGRSAAAAGGAAQGNASAAPGSGSPLQTMTAGPAQSGQAVLGGPNAGAPPALGHHSITGQTVHGTVTAPTAGGATLVNSSAGLLSLGNKVDLPPGAQVTLEVLSQTQPSVSAPPTAPLSGLLMTGSGANTTAGSAWQTLSDTLDLLQRIDPQAARQLASQIPASDPRLVANVVAYNQAMRSNEPGRWVPSSALSALERLGPKGTQLAEKLGSELRELSQRSQRPTPGGGEWRTLSIPFMDGGAISQINVITRRLGADEDLDGAPKRRKGGGQGQRFLIDLSLSHLGDLQFDGLYKRKVRTLDLIIRSRDTLPKGIRLAINTLFSQSSEALNLSGGVAFRVTDDFAGPPPGAKVAVPPSTASEPDETETVPVIPHTGWTA